jgi:predicted phosphodiesterase
MKTLIIGDTHIEERSINEIEAIFEADIFPLASSCQRIIQLGDYYEKNKPTPIELKYGTYLAKRLTCAFKEVIIISGTGEHDLFHDTSVIEYLEAVGVKAVKGDYIENKVLYGHFMLHESKLEYGTGKYGLKDLEGYTHVFLGHQHTPQNFNDKVCHVGSIRYQNFNESKDPYKRVLILNSDTNKVTEKILNSTIPMKDTTNIAELYSLDTRNKIRYICKSFEDYRLNATTLNKIGKKFVQFKIKLDFKDEANKELIASKIETKAINKNEIIKKYIEEINDLEVKKLLKEIINE